MNVISYSTARGQKISLTPRQIATLEKAGIWPRSNQGEEYATVSHGLHDGCPTTDAQSAQEIYDAIN